MVWKNAVVSMESFQCVPSICLLMLQAAVYSVWCTAWALLTCHKEHHSQRCQLVCCHLPTGNLSTTCVLHFFCISIFNSYIYIWILINLMCKFIYIYESFFKICIYIERETDRQTDRQTEKQGSLWLQGTALCRKDMKRKYNNLKALSGPARSAWL